MKKIIFMCLSLAIILCGCGGEEGNPDIASVPASVVSLKTNPEISFVLDGNDRVMSVVGDNNDGKMLIQGESLVGINISDAIDLIIKIEKDTGFLVSASSADNKIEISVSSDTEEKIKDIQEKIKGFVESTCEKYNIEETIETTIKYTKEQLASFIEEMNSRIDTTSSTYQELLTHYYDYQLEIKDLYSEELVDLYKSVKQGQIELAESKVIKDYLATVTTIDADDLQAYNLIYETLTQCIDDLEEEKYSLLLDEEGVYQTTLAAYTSAKNNYNLQVARISKMPDGPVKNAAMEILDGFEMAFEYSESTLEQSMKIVNDSMELFQNAITTALEELEQWKDEHLTEEVSNQIEIAIENADALINQTIDSKITDFKEKYQSAIDNAKTAATTRKGTLKSTES